MKRLTEEEIINLVTDYHFSGEQNRHILAKSVAKAQLKKDLLSIESRFRREVIPSGSQTYTQEEIELLKRLNSAYYMISKDDWQALLEEAKNEQD